MVFHTTPRGPAAADPRAVRPHGVLRRAACRLSGFLAALALAAVAVSCASGPPSLDDPGISRKLDLRLRTALRGTGWSEDLGEYVRVIVRMDRDERPGDRAAIEAVGSIGSWSSRILTLTLPPSNLVDLAAIRHVAFVELSMKNAPAPAPPPTQEAP